MGINVHLYVRRNRQDYWEHLDYWEQLASTDVRISPQFRELYKTMGIEKYFGDDGFHMRVAWPEISATLDRGKTLREQYQKDIGDDVFDLRTRDLNYLIAWENILGDYLLLLRAGTYVKLGGY